MPKQINILHLDTEKTWRGGQQQVFYLHKGLISEGIKSILVSNTGSEILDRCKEESLPHYTISMFGELDIFAAFKLSRLCKKENINILQAHSAHALSIGIFTKLFSPSLILIGVRRVDFSIGKSIFNKLKYNNGKVDKLICISDYIKKVLLKDGIPEEKLVTVRSGVDINKFDDIKPPENFRNNLGIKKDEYLIGTVAAFAGHKDYPNLLKAFSILRKRNPNIKLCIVGDGSLKKQVYDLANELNIFENIIFTGYVNNVGNYLKSFDVFVLASKKEGLGTSIIDALAIGCPVVTTRTGGIPELIENEENGILVDPKNPNLLADALGDLLSNSEKRSRLSIAAKESAKKYSIEQTVNQNISVYKSLIN